MKSLKNSILIGLLLFSIIAFSQQNLFSRHVLNNKINILLPKDFVLMQNDMLKLKYPIAGSRPTEVYTNESGSINFAFKHTINRINEDNLSEIFPVFIKQFNSIYPQIQWIGKEVKSLNNKNFIVLEFITPAVDTRIYNLMYITELDGNMLMCSFNCIESQKEEWQSKAKQSLNSIEIK